MIDINDYNKDDIIASCLIEAANVLSESANREELINVNQKKIIYREIGINPISLHISLIYTEYI